MASDLNELVFRFKRRCSRRRGMVFSRVLNGFKLSYEAVPIKVHDDKLRSLKAQLNFGLESLLGTIAIAGFSYIAIRKLVRR